MAWKCGACIGLLIVVLAAACGGATRTDGVAGGAAGAPGGAGTSGSSPGFTGGVPGGGGTGAILTPGGGAPSSDTGGAFTIVTPQPDAGSDPCIPPADVRIDFSSALTPDAGARDGGVEAGAKEAGAALDAGVFACSVELPILPARRSFDPDKVNVMITTDTNQRLVFAVRDRAACAAFEPSTEEWYYDDPVRPTRIAFCPDTCDRFRSIGVAVVTVLYGCRVDLPP